MAALLSMTSCEWQEKEGSLRRMHSHRADTWSFVICWLPWTLEALTEAQAPWWTPICSALGMLEFRLSLQMHCVLYGAKGTQGTTAGWCLGLQRQTQVHPEWWVPRARDRWDGFVGIKPPSPHTLCWNCHSMLLFMKVSFSNQIQLFQHRRAARLALFWAKRQVVLPPHNGACATAIIIAALSQMPLCLSPHEITMSGYYWPLSPGLQVVIKTRLQS